MHHGMQFNKALYHNAKAFVYCRQVNNRKNKISQLFIK